MKTFTTTQFMKVEAVRKQLGDNFYHYLGIRKLENKVNEGMKDFGSGSTITLCNATRTLLKHVPDYLSAIDAFLDYTEHKEQYEFVNDVKNEKITSKKTGKNRKNK